MMNALSSFMPGEHDWMKQTVPTGAAAGIMPQKKGPVMNALGAAFQILAPEGYERGRQAKMSREIGNALSRDNYQDAAKVAYGAGDWQTGMQLGEYGQNQQDAQRKREAQGALQLFTSLQPGQVTQYAMEDPVGFERMTGMSSDEYMQMGQRFAQMGVTPEQFADYVVKQAQAELGITPTQKDPLVVNNRVLDPNDPSRVLGDYSDPLVVNDQIVDRSNYGVQADLRTPQAPKYATTTTEEGVYGYNTADPTDRVRMGGAPVKTPLVSVNTGDMPSKSTLTPLQLKMDEKYAETLAEWNTGGGPDVVKNLSQIVDVAKVLESGSGNYTGALIGLTPDWALAGLNPEAINQRELVEEVVQRNLRVTLGAQFTAKEGENLIKRAYNKNLPEEMNAKRLRRLAQLIEGRAQQLTSLNQYMLENGTSAGWDGSLISADQMLSELDSISGGANAPGKGQVRRRWNSETQTFEVQQ